MHDLDIYDHTLPDIDDAFSGDSRTLSFQVTDGNGDGVDISNATVTWGLWDREYLDDDADAELTQADSGVEVVTDNRVDTSIGQFEIRLDPQATEDLWGDFYHRPAVEQSDGSVASWRGVLTITA